MNNSHAQVQLPLSVQLRDEASFDNFFAGSNNELVNQLMRSCVPQVSEGTIFFSGSVGTGKTHLLHSACHLAQKNKASAVYLPMSEFKNESPEMLEGLEQLHLICIDDIQVVAGDAVWEEALFHFYNRVFESGVQLVIAGDNPIAQLGVKLPDLASRLAWGFVYRLKPLDDAQKLLALQDRATRRGFELPDAVGQYLLRHYQRDMNALYEMLQRLDVASLAAQRNKLSIPFVKQCLESEQTDQVQLF